MGYTHYWKFLKMPTQKAIESILKQVSIIRQITKGIKIQEEYDISQPAIFSQKQIRLNGCDNDGHQTFLINFATIKEGQFNCCKTAYKPYDLVVCLILLSINNNVDSFDLRSDGGSEQWQPIVQTYQKNITKIVKNTQNIKKLLE